VNRWYVSRYAYEQRKRQWLDAVHRADEMTREAVSYAVQMLDIETRASRDKKDAAQEIERLNEVIRRLFGEQDDLKAELEASRGIAVVDEPLTPEQQKKMLENRCVNCGGVHSIACPRIKRMRFRADGQTPLEVEFWPDSEWPKDRVVWIEDIPELASPS
jgi:hypothetical protein